MSIKPASLQIFGLVMNPHDSAPQSLTSAEDDDGAADDDDDDWATADDWADEDSWIEADDVKGKYLEQLYHSYNQFLVNFVPGQQIYPGVYVITEGDVTEKAEVELAVMSICGGRFDTLSSDLEQILGINVKVHFYGVRETVAFLLETYGGQMVNELVVSEDERYEQPIWQHWLDCMSQELRQKLERFEQPLPGIYVRSVQAPKLSLSMCFLPPKQEAIRKRFVHQIFQYCQFMGFKADHVTLTQLTLEETLHLWENQVAASQPVCLADEEDPFLNAFL